MLIDTHAHIYLAQFDQDIDEIVERSTLSGIHKIFLPNIDHTSIERMLSLEENYGDLCIPMMGLHPCSVKEDFEKELSIVESWLSKRAFAGIGETGIDLYWDKKFYYQQIEALKIQLGFARKYNIPIILHCRDSIQETINLVSTETNGSLAGIFHCFTGTYEQAMEIISFGFKLGIGGVVTFKNSQLNEVIEKIDLEHIVLETDSPYLAPEPERGKRNEPSYLKYIAQKIADIKEVEIEKLIDITTKNAFELFKEWN
ncbi:TatD family hydrolase [Bacteroidota bacterium]